METIKIKGEFIKLDQFLKHANLVQTGGHAKILIKDGLVKVNGEVELQRGKKLYNDYIVELGEDKFVVKNEEISDSKKY